MEELKYRGKKREGRHRDTWDPFQLNPIGAEKESKRRCFQLAQYLVAVIVGLAVLTSAVVAKGSLLVLSTMSSPTSLRSPKEKQFYMLMLVFCLVFPNFLMFVKSLWKCAFKSFVQPNMKTLAFVCAIECLVSLGTSVLVLVVMPQFDVLTNLFISGGVCIVSAILQIVFRLQRKTWKIVFPLCSLILTVAGFCDSLIHLSQKNTTAVVILEITRSICRTSLNSSYLQWPFSMLALEGVCMWSGFVSCTYYVWKIKVQRIERTSQLFVRRLYESAFIDLSLLLNTKMKVPRARNEESQDDIQECVIYLCATMWHETYDEMLKILTSMFRLDRYRGDPKEEHKDCFDFECHIFVDDAFMTDEDTGKRLVNTYVNDLIKVVIEVYRVFTNKEPDDVSIIEAPYGGRLMFIMPEGNMLYIHLKDKKLIRNKKRWSQRQNNLCRASLISLDGESYLLPQYDNDYKRKLISDDHTYILALDGDTDFQPKAVILLIDSLFRGSALMDDNVLKRYTTTATKAAEYVQYDQGEDRWLCTLLLQQGWRVEYNAASDAYTNSPEEFKEFYNQRRRWGPSTLANTLDLLHSGAETVKKNSSISRLYIFYQMFSVGSSILGPASVTLMIAGAFQFVFKIEGTLSILIASLPPVFYIIVCFVAKSNNQITIAAIMSVFYAFLMTASLFSIIGDMVIQGTFLTPTGVFLVSMTIMYLVTALLHPEEFVMIVYGLMYFICIPSGYLLLTIYSLVNMHVVTWGTRETTKKEEVKKNTNIMCDRNCTICCWDMKCQVTQESENLMLQQITGLNAQHAPNTLNTNLQTSQHATVNLELQNKPDTTMEEFFERAQAPPTDKHNKTNIDKDDDTDSSSSDDSSEKKSLSMTPSMSASMSVIGDEDDFSLTGIPEETEELPVSDWVIPVKEEFLKKLTYANMRRNLQAQIRYTLRNKNQDDLCEELVLMLTDTLNVELSHARRIIKVSQLNRLEKRVMRAIEKTLIAPQVQKLDEGEQDFWHKLLERYLKPIVDVKAHQEEVTRELKSLRNKSVFLYFIINVLWVVATFFLQAIGNDVISIKIPKYYPNGTEAEESLKVEPLSLMFLLSFAVLLVMQFLAMLYHRVYTLIHVVSYRSTEKDYKQKDDEVDDDVLIMENHSANGLVLTSDDL
ncbi:unnamed protein product [Pleuronectes platessa]|uniref:chitin synthase n=1 Tax=Pleuronectes platessa TaxID=8262 RepID=A0A9N7UBG5_PLEPL|nr:unnamed protein product [Pleuronectes platessa]